MRKLIAIIGDAHFKDIREKWAITSELAHKLIDSGYRIVHGGLGDIARAASEGARKSEYYREGDLIAILPSFDPEEAFNTGDIILATGLDMNRNIIIANSDAVIAIGGGAGTLSELAFAWSLKRPIFAFQIDGWSGKLAGTQIDDRIRIDYKIDQLIEVSTVEQVISLLPQTLESYTKRHRGIVVKSESEI